MKTPRKTRHGHNLLSGLALDLIGSAIALAVVWGLMTTLFEIPSIHDQLRATPPVKMAYNDLYDSVMTEDSDWQMLARQ